MKSHGDVQEIAKSALRDAPVLAKGWGDDPMVTCDDVAEAARGAAAEKPKKPMPPDTLIKVGMLADVKGHGDGLAIEGISIALCPSRDAAAEGDWEDYTDDPATAATVTQIEAALLSYAVFGLSYEGKRIGWCYGRQIRRVYEKGADHEG